MRQEKALAETRASSLECQVASLERQVTKVSLLAESAQRDSENRAHVSVQLKAALESAQQQLALLNAENRMLLGNLRLSQLQERVARAFAVYEFLSSKQR